MPKPAPFKALGALLLAAALWLPAQALGANRCEGAPGGGLTLTNVAAHGGELIAIGSDGLVASARNPARWTVQGTPSRHDLRGVVWSGSRWVAVGDIGTVLRRGNGGWEAATGVPPVGLRAAVAGDGRVLAAGSAGTVVASTPSAGAWSRISSGTTNTLWGGTALGSTLLLGGEQTTVVASEEGGAFAPIPTYPRPTRSEPAPRPFLWQLADDEKRVVAVGDFGAILAGTPARGLHGVASPTDEILRGVAYANRRWVAVGSGGVTLFSKDGLHWRSGSDPSTVDLRGVAHTPAGWVAVGDQSTVIVSRDGRRWRVAVSAMPCSLLGVAAGADRLVAVGGAGKVLVAMNGCRWTAMTRPTREDLYAVAKGTPGFVAVGAGGTILTSADGREWTPRRSPTPLNLHTVFWTGSEFLAGGDRGIILASRQGRNWRQVPFSGFHSVRGFAAGEGTVVAAGAGTIARREGPSWEFQSTGLQRFQTGVAYGGGRFVIVGHNGEALVSTDAGRTWTPGVSGVEVNLDAVVWTGSRFLAGGEGTLIASADGLTWEPVRPRTRRSLRAFAVFGARVVAVGDGGVIVRLAKSRG